MTTDARTVCHTPTPGKKPTSIPTWKYEALREAILNAVPKAAPGIPAKDLPQRIAPLLSADVKARLGSLTWHTTTVKLHLESTGELQRDARLKPQHVYRP